MVRTALGAGAAVLVALRGCLTASLFLLAGATLEAAVDFATAVLLAAVLMYWAVTS